MNVVNNNSEYLAIIVNSYASTLKLRLLVEDVENFTIDMQVNDYEEYDDETNIGVVSEPLPCVNQVHTKNKGISISAASLERFQTKG